MTFRILGLMTGTSCDALDGAMITFEKTRWSLKHFFSHPYPRSLRNKIFSFQNTSTFSLQTLLTLEQTLNRWYARVVQKWMQPLSNPPDLLALHGQTVFHQKGLSLQLGQPFVLCHHTQRTCAGFFRQGNLASGGEGAPLVPFFHLLLAKKWNLRSRGILFLNLGGIANLTYVPPKNSDHALLALDLGPGNTWIDTAASIVTDGRLHFDRNGSLAKQASAHAPTVKALLKHPFFKSCPPKSIGRETLCAFFQHTRTHSSTPPSALVATALEATVKNIHQQIKRWILKKGLPLHTLFICGGGAKNPLFLKKLQSCFPKQRVTTTDAFQTDPQQIEAQAFAYLALLSLLAQPLGGTWSGTQKPWHPPAALVPGKNWFSLLKKIHTQKKAFLKTYDPLRL